MAAILSGIFKAIRGRLTEPVLLLKQLTSLAVVITLTETGRAKSPLRSEVKLLMKKVSKQGQNHLKNLFGLPLLLLTSAVLI